MSLPRRIRVGNNTRRLSVRQALFFSFPRQARVHLCKIQTQMFQNCTNIRTGACAVSERKVSSKMRVLSYHNVTRTNELWLRGIERLLRKL